MFEDVDEDFRGDARYGRIIEWQGREQSRCFGGPVGGDGRQGKEVGVVADKEGGFAWLVVVAIVRERGV